MPCSQEKVISHNEHTFICCFQYVQTDMLGLPAMVLALVFVLLNKQHEKAFPHHRYSQLFNQE